MLSSNPEATQSIRHRSTTTGYSDKVLAAVVELGRARAPSDLLDRLATATATIGATGSVYAATIPEERGAASCFSVFACEPGFALAEEPQRLLKEHPWFRFAGWQSTTRTDGDIELVAAKDAELVEVSRQCGFKSALIVPTPAVSAGGRVEVLCVGSKHADDFAGPTAPVVRALVHALAAELHLWLTGHLRARLDLSAGLDDEDLDVLSMEWRGMTSKQISRKTGHSLDSINSRFRRINRRMNCHSRSASAQRAAAYGLFEMFNG